MKRRGVFLKSVLAIAGVTAVALPLYAQIAPEEDPASMRKNSRAQDNADYDPEPYYIDGVEYKPYDPSGAKPPKAQVPQVVAKPSASQNLSPGAVDGNVGASQTADGKSSATNNLNAQSSLEAEDAAIAAIPEKRVRYGSAVIQAVDKVTAENVRFEARIGKPIRYKGLVFTIKACETSAQEEAMSDVMAYMDVRTSPPPTANGTQPKPKQIFQGWTYASTPGLNPMEHAVYDAWVVSCRTPLPVTVAARP